MIIKDRKSDKYRILKNNNDYYNRFLSNVYGISLMQTNICYVNIIKNKIIELYGV
jgi:hypothetical protein